MCVSCSSKVEGLVSAERLGQCMKCNTFQCLRYCETTSVKLFIATDEGRVTSITAFANTIHMVTIIEEVVLMAGIGVIMVVEGMYL